MTTTRLKLVVNTVQLTINNDGTTNYEDITLSAVYSDKEGSANKQWSRWTPSGQLKFQVSNPAVFGKFRPGQFYFADLTECDKDAM